jgi:hypothetical protein
MRRDDDAWEYFTGLAYPRLKYAPDHHYTRWYTAGLKTAGAIRSVLAAIGHFFRGPALFCLAFWRVIDPRKE